MIKFLVFAGMFLVSVPVMAKEAIMAFQTPSGQIYCEFEPGENEDAVLRCDFQSDNPEPVIAKPAECDLDWGRSFSLAATGGVIPNCYGDTIANPENFILKYGERLTRQGIYCLSEKTGLTCHNTSGHGFVLSRGKQSLF